MNTLPYELCEHISSYAQPVHPCREALQDLFFNYEEDCQHDDRSFITWLADSKDWIVVEYTAEMVTGESVAEYVKYLFEVLFKEYFCDHVWNKLN